MTYISFKYRWTWEVSHCTNTDCLLLYAISLIKQCFWILRCLFGYFFFSPFLHISPWKKKEGDTRFNRLEQSARRSITTRPGHISLSLSLLVSHARIQISTVHRNTSLKTLSLYIIYCCVIFCRVHHVDAAEIRIEQRSSLNFQSTSQGIDGRQKLHHTALLSSHSSPWQLPVLKALFKNHSVRKIRLREL